MNSGPYRTFALIGVLLLLGSLAYALDAYGGKHRAIASIQTLPADPAAISMQVSAAASGAPQSTFQKFSTYYSDMFTTFSGTVQRYLAGIFSTGTRPGIEGTAQIGSGNTLVSAQLPGGQNTRASNVPVTITCTSQAGATKTVSGAQYHCNDTGKTIVTALAPSGASTWVIVFGSGGTIEQQLNCFDQPDDTGPYDFTANEYCITSAPGSNHEAGLGRYLVACQSTVGDACAQNSPPPPVENAAPVVAPQVHPVQTATLTVVPQLVHPGGTARVSWTSQNALSCTLSGTNGDQWKDISGEETSGAIHQRTTYTLTCKMKDGQSLIRSAVVNIVPTFQER